MALIGAFLLLDTLDIIVFNFAVVWPVILIAFGVSVLVRALERNRIRPGVRRSMSGAAPVVGSHCHFQRIQERQRHPGFPGRSRPRAIFGAARFDLRNASMTVDEARIDVNVVFGEVEVRVPETWNVINRAARGLRGRQRQNHSPQARSQRQDSPAGNHRLGDLRRHHAAQLASTIGQFHHASADCRTRQAMRCICWRGAPLALLLAYLLVMMGGLGWLEAATLSLPLALFYALICLAPWYMCRVLPLGSAPLSRFSAIIWRPRLSPALIWIVLAKGLGLALGHYFFARLNERLSPQLPLLFGIGVLLYLLSVALHYVLLSMESSKEAETREQEALTLARESELKALKAQINPHFLFNSLNSISALATVDGQRARDMCIKLSDFLRTTLKLGEKQRITLADELALAKAYLEVEQVRFGARLRVEIDADADCDQCVVPSLVLQPLVENAVKHGIAGLVDGGTIRLEAHCSDGHAATQNLQRIRSRVAGSQPPRAGSAECSRPAARVV